MARIFISHSSADNPQAVVLRDWLVEEGWNDLFLDLDPSRGIAAGERWERRLHEATNRCEAILFLVSRAWLQSDWCLREFRLAQKLNKRSFGILIEPIPVRDLPAELTAHWQFVDLAQGADHRIFRAVLPDGSESHVTFSTSGLQRLKAGLTRAGLDARFFPWPPEGDPDRPPYRGMRPLEAGDAGIFFGREAPTIEALDRLRGLSEAAAPRFMVILGASGAGKSSFLRAGLLPHLARDDRAFLPLPIVRPERAAITGDTGLIRSLEAAAASAGVLQSRARIKASIEDGASAVAALLAALAEKVRAPAGTNETRPHPPRIVLAIDQAEELFLAEGAAEAEAFLGLVRDLASDPASNLIVIATIRSDAYERLQTAPALEGVRQEAVSLPPMPKGAYQTVIEGPAARLAETRRPLKVEPALTAALLHDVEQGGAKDALPLLAFTLERLYLEHGGDGDLRLSEYRQVGGIRGSIDAAVEGALRSADSDPAVPRDRGALEALLRRALIPWLAGIDSETGAPRRRIARLSEIAEEARPLVTHLVASRLLATDRNPDTGETTVEPAHEALLRQWGLLQGWLEEDFAALAALEGVKRAARDWEANARAGDWLALAAGRLDDAEALLARDDFAASLDPSDRAYLSAARAADTARRDRELTEARKLATAQQDAAAAATLAAEKQRQVARRTRLGLVAASLLAVVAIAAGVYALDQAQEAETQAAHATEHAEIADTERQRAEEQRREAEQQAEIARRQRELAEAKTIEAEQQRQEAETQRAEAARQEAVAENRRQEAERQRAEAEVQKESAEESRRLAEVARAEAEHERQRAERNFAAAKQVVEDLIYGVVVGLDISGMRADRMSEILETMDYTVSSLVEVTPDNADLQETLFMMLLVFERSYERVGDHAKVLEIVRRQLTVKSTIGGIRLREGDYEGAIAAYEESLSIARKIAMANPTSALAQRDIAATLDFIGDVKFESGDREGALSAFEEGLPMSRALAEADAGNAVAQRALWASLNKIGDMKLQAGDRDGALAAYEEALATARALAKTDPGNVQVQPDLLASLSNGDAKLQAGDRDGALAAYEEVLAVARALAEADPGNVGAQLGLELSLEKIGDVKLEVGDDGWIAAFQESRAISHSLAEARNARAQTDVVVSLTNVASVVDDARPLLAEALAILDARGAEGRLTTEEQGWISLIKARLAAWPREEESATVE